MLIMLMAMVIFLSMTGCSDKEADPGVTIDEISTESLEDAETAEGESDADADLDDVVEDAGTLVAGPGAGGKIAQDELRRLRCADIDHDKENKIITITFPEEGCIGPHGRVRKGTVVITYTGRRRVPGSVWTITPDGYSVNDRTISGVKTITNISDAEDLSEIIFEVSLVGGVITWPDGTSATRDHEGTRTCVRNDDDRDLDEFWREGEASGVNRRGLNYTITIQDRLVLTRRCWLEGVFIPVKGIKVISIEGEEDMIIDYGVGECDYLVTITKGDRSVEKNVERRVKNSLND